MSVSPCTYNALFYEYQYIFGTYISFLYKRYAVFFQVGVGVLGFRICCLGFRVHELTRYAVLFGTYISFFYVSSAFWDVYKCVLYKLYAVHISV